MKRKEILPSNAEAEPTRNVKMPEDEDVATPRERMRGTPGEPAISKVPSITQGMLKEEEEEEEEEDS